MIKPLQLRISLFLFSVLLFVSYAYSLHIHPYRVFYHDALVVLGLALMIGIWALVPALTCRIPDMILLPLALIIIIAVQLCSGAILYPADMIFPVLYLLLFALCLICGATIASQKNGLSELAGRLAECFLLSGVFAVALQHVQLLNLDLMPWVVSLNWSAPLRPFANFAQANTLALVLCFALASLWHIHLTHRFRPLFSLILALILLWGLALTESRIGWLILPLFVALIGNSENSARRTLLLCLITFIAFVLFTPYFLRAIGGIADSVENRAGQTEVRIVLWQQAVAFSMDHPWLGVGWFQFGPNQVWSAVNFKPTEYSEYAHNILLNLAAEIGWPFTILFIVVMGAWAYRCCVCKRSDQRVRYFSLLLIALGVHSMVEYPLWYGFFLFPVGLILGALDMQSLGAKIIDVPRGWFIFFSLAMIGGMGLVTLDYRRMSDGFHAIDLIQQGDKRYLSSIKKPALTLFPQFYDYFHVIEVNPDFNMPPRDLAFLVRISARFGFAPILERLAIAYADNGRPADALHALRTIERLDTANYSNTYARWQENADKNPGAYGDIFRRMPIPSKSQERSLKSFPR